MSDVLSNGISRGILISIRQALAADFACSRAMRSALYGINRAGKGTDELNGRDRGEKSVRPTPELAHEI
jgi:hypothetical protein